MIDKNISQMTKILIYSAVLVILSDFFLDGTYFYQSIIEYKNKLVRKMLILNSGANGETSNADAVNDHLEKGKRFLAAGQLSDAITHFHAAIGK